MKRTWSLIAMGVSAAVCLPCAAADLSVKLTLPSLEGSRGRAPQSPYVAIWLRRSNDDFAANLAVWYRIAAKQRRGGSPDGMGSPDRAKPSDDGGERGSHDAGPQGGARWLNELRQWWSDSGSKLSYPVDGLTSASRAAGEYEVVFNADRAPLNKLPPGDYRLMVEVAREHGGSDLVGIPFEWPVKAAQTFSAHGKSELGALALTLQP